MISGVFREYRHTEQEWKGQKNKGIVGISQNIWDAMYQWNEEYKKLGTAGTLVSLVSASKFVVKNSYEMRLDIVASPISLMKANFYEVSAGNVLSKVGNEDALIDYDQDDDVNTFAKYTEAKSNDGKLKRYVKYSQDFQYSDDGGASFVVSCSKSTWKSLFPNWKSEYSANTDDAYWGEFPTPVPTPVDSTREPTNTPTSRPSRGPQPTAKPNSDPSPTPKPTTTNMFRVKDKTPTPTSSSWNERFENDPMEFKINKYSYWIAAAVNMKILSFDDLM